MEFVTYQNRTSKQATVHVKGCRHVAKHGGTHKYGQGGYEHFPTFAAADAYAQATGFPVKHCSFCVPQGRPTAAA